MNYTILGRRQDSEIQGRCDDSEEFNSHRTCNHGRAGPARPHLEFSRQENTNGVFPSPGIFPNQGSNPGLCIYQAVLLPSEGTEAQILSG